MPVWDWLLCSIAWPTEVADTSGTSRRESVLRLRVVREPCQKRLLLRLCQSAVLLLAKGVPGGHGHRGVFVLLAGVSVPDLPVTVPSPAPGFPGGVQGTRVVVAGGGGGVGAVSGHGHWDVLVQRLAEVPGPVTDLPGTVVSPAPGFPGGVQCTRVQAAARFRAG